MKVKTYVFEDVKVGMEAIKAQYGSDTIIIDIKNNGNNLFRKSCEISIAVDEEPQSSTYDLIEVRKKTEKIWNYALLLMNERLACIENDIIKERTREYPLPLRILFDKLVKNGFERKLAMSLISEVYGEIGDSAQDSIKANASMKRAIAQQISMNNIIEESGSILMLGPTGAGKTQTTKKLAKILASRDKAVSIVAYDPFTKGSYDDLMSFSESHGLPFSFTTNEEDIGFIVERDRRQKIIDITGHSSIQMKVLERLQDISKIIVLPAGARDEKMQSYCSEFDNVTNTTIGFTKLDEEESLGHIGHNLLRLGLPVSFLTTGIGIDDIVIPDHESLFKILLEGNIWKKEERKPLP
jgi:flagellar biosynthesis GTPase FlhF